MARSFIDTPMGPLLLDCAEDQLMDDKDRLAIAEEIIKSRRESWVCNLHDVALRWSHDAATSKKEYTAQRTTNHGSYISGGGPDLAVSECPIDCVIAARQKLAAEKEASRTPEERRLREVLTKIRDGLPSITCRQIGELVEQALEQGA